jgi:predicted Zn-dependent protease
MMHTDLNPFRSFFKPLLTILAVIPLLAACSANPATGERQFAALMSPQQEVQVGAEEHAKVMQAIGDRNVSQDVKDMVGRIGARVAANTERPDVQYKFFVLDSPMINAFALPGGYVYVTRGLLAMANSEAEIAAVLAHEVGHITGRHSAERYSRGMVASLGAAVIAAALDTPTATQAASLSSNLYIQSYSRGQESEADQLGIRYLQRAGYDPAAMAAFLRNLQRSEQLESALTGKTQGPSYFSSHPATADRVAQAQAMAQGLSGEDDRDRFLRALDGMIYGDSAEHGFTRGNAFYHPEMGFTFDVPAGFNVQNESTQVIAAAPNGAVMIFDAVRNAQNMTPGTYIPQAWLKRAVPVERMTVNGMDAATASFNGTVGGKAATIRVIAVQWSPTQFFRFQVAIPQGADSAQVDALKSATYSLRPLSAEEKNTIQPLKLRIVTARVGDSVQSLSAAMPFNTMRPDRFRVLNGLDPGQEVRAGALYKLVSDR